MSGQRSLLIKLQTYLQLLGRLVQRRDRSHAMSAEVMAGALKENRRAKLIGQTTFGKGLVQTVLPLPRGGAVKLTTSRYFTP